MIAYPGQSMTGLGGTPALWVGPNSTYTAGAPTLLGLGVTLSAGAVLTCKVQVSWDPKIPGNPVNWNDHDVLVNLTVSANGNIAYPVSAVRLVITSYTSGSANLGVVQWP